MAVEMSRRLSAALDAVGARLKRSKKHLVYELPNGRTFVTAKTPGDSRGDLNAICDLQAAAGVDLSETRRKATPEARAERRARPGRRDSDWGRTRAVVSPMAQALSSAGVVEQRLRADVEALMAMLRVKDARIAELEALWVVRAWTWLAGGRE